MTPYFGNGIGRVGPLDSHVIVIGSSEGHVFSLPI